jgi:hypothetical protein
VLSPQGSSPPSFLVRIIYYSSSRLLGATQFLIT